MPLRISTIKIPFVNVPESESISIDRRFFLHAGLSAGAIAIVDLVGAVGAKAQAMTLQSIANDPDAPIAGNPSGDVVIVAFLDYNCQYCMYGCPRLSKFLDGVVE